MVFLRREQTYVSVTPPLDPPSCTLRPWWGGWGWWTICWSSAVPWGRAGRSTSLVTFTAAWMLMRWTRKTKQLSRWQPKKVLSISDRELHYCGTSLFMGDHCLQILWVTLNYKFTSPQKYNQVMNCLILECNNQVTFEIMSQWTSKILIIHKHWPGRIRILPQYPYLTGSSTLWYTVKSWYDVRITRSDSVK